MADASRGQEVWLGGVDSNWSTGLNWQDGTAPITGGGSDLTLSFKTRGGATTATNNLGGEFTLNQLSFQHDGTGVLTVSSSSALRFGGSGAGVTLLGTGDATLSAPVILNSTSGALTFTGGGAGSLILSGMISDGETSGSLVIRTTPPAPESQVLVLAHANTFSGGVNLQSGTLALQDNQALGTGTLTVTGGALQFRGEGRTISNPIQLAGTLTVSGSQGATLTGGITSTDSAAGLHLRLGNAATLTLNAAAAYAGGTIIDGGSDGTSGGTLRLVGNGTLAATNSITVRAGGKLALAGTSTVNRLSDSAPVRLQGGQLTIEGLINENIGALSFGGQATIAMPSSGAVLHAGVLSRDGRGTVLFQGNASLGGSAASHSKIFFANAPILVGGDGTGPAVSIVPYAIADTTQTGAGNTFVTYSTQGIRPLDLNTEFSTSLTSGAINNVRITSGGNLTAKATVNSLLLSSSAFGISGSGEITITSGALLSAGSQVSISPSLAFGSAEANLFVTGALRLDGVVSGSGGLTKSGGGTLTLTRTNSFTGPLTINAGTVGFSNANQLGADSGAIVFDGSGGTLLYSGGTLNFSRPLEIKSGTATLELAATTVRTWNIAGQISGEGGLRVKAPWPTAASIRLSADNTYSGPTYLERGILEIAADSSLGSKGEFVFVGSQYPSTLRTIGPWTSSRKIQIDGSATLDTAGNDAVLSGYIDGAGALTKAGAGSLTISTSSPFSGSVTISGGGSLHLSGDGRLSSPLYQVNSGSQLVLNYGPASTAKLNPPAGVNLTNASMSLSGNPGMEVREGIATLTAREGFSALVLHPEGTAGISLRANTLTSDAGDLFIRGTNLGGSSAGPRTTFAVVTGPVARGGLIEGVTAASSVAGGESFAVYSTTILPDGTRGVEALSAYSDPSALGGEPDPSANILVSGVVPSFSGNSATAHTLTIEGGSSFTFNAGKILSLTHGSLLARSGDQPSAILGRGVLDLGPGPGTIHTFGEFTLDSDVTGSGWSKAGPGTLVLGTQSPGSAPISVRSGELRALNTAALRDKIVELLPYGSFTVPTGTVQLGGVTQSGMVSVAAGATLELGTASEDWQFNGRLSGDGTLRVVGENDAVRVFNGPVSTLTGAAVLSSGRVQFSNSNKLTAGTLILEGGVLFPPSGGSTISAPLILNQDLWIEGAYAVTLTTPSGVSGAAGFRLVAENNLVLETAASNTGATQLTGESLLTVRGPMGALTGTTEIQVARGAELRLANDTSTNGNIGGRLRDDSVVSLGGGVLSLSAGSGIAALEAVGRINVDQVSDIQFYTDSFASKSSTVLVTSELHRGPAGLLIVGGAQFGADNPDKVAAFKVAAPPEMIGGGASTGPDVSIVPWVFSHPYVGEGTPASLVTYSEERGFVPLQATDYRTSPASVTAPTNNLKLSGNHTLTESLRINALVLGDAGQTSLAGENKLSVTSGTLLNRSISSISTAIDFGTSDAKILTAGGVLTLSGTVSGSGGLTKAGFYALKLAGQNDFTGPITIHSGSLNFASPGSLGDDTTPIVISAADYYGAGLYYDGDAAATLARDVHVNGQTSYLGVAKAGAILTLTGTISGNGAVRIDGPGMISLPHANSYTGDTYISGGVLLGSDASLGSGKSVYLTGTTGMVLRLASDWETDRDVVIANSGAVVDTNGFDAVWNGAFRGNGSAIKEGQGTLTIKGNSTNDDDFSVNAGTLRITDRGVLGSRFLWMGTETSLVIDNTSIAHSNRIADSARIALPNSSEFKLLGNASVPVTEAVGTLSSGQATITISSPGARTILSADGWQATYANPVLIRGTDLGQGGESGTRLVFRTLPQLRGGLLPGAYVASTADASVGDSFAFYDTTSDAYGVIGVRPMRLSDFESGANLRDRNHGGATPNYPNVRLVGTHTADGSSLTINTLTVAGSGTLQIPDKHLASLDLGLIRNPVGSTLNIQGGWLKLPMEMTKLTGDGNVRISGSAVYGMGLEKSGAGQITLSGGSISALHNSAGDLRIESGAPFKAGTIIHQGGSFTIASTNARADQLSSDQEINVTGNLTVGALQGTGTVHLSGGTLTITGSNTAASTVSSIVEGTGTLRLTGPGLIKGNFTGPLITEGISLGISEQRSFPNITRLEQRGGGVGLSNIGTSVPSGLQITSVGGSVGWGEESGASAQLGRLSTAGSVTIAISPIGRETGQFRFDEVQTGVGSTLTFIRNFPQAPEGLGKLFLGSEMTSRLVGAGDASIRTPILPFAIGHMTAFMNYEPDRLLTYDSNTGLRWLELSEYATGIESGANVRLAASVILSENTSINALHLFSGSVVSGPGTLAVDSGMLFGERGGGIGSDTTVDFGNRMAYIFSQGSIQASDFSPLRLNGTLKGAGGFSISGDSRVELNGANQITGPAVLNSGTIAFSNPASLGAGSAPVTIYDATLEFSGATLDRPFKVEGYRATFKGGASNPVISGSISGSGNVVFDGPLTLTGNNSYTGATELSGNISIQGASVFGESSKLKLNNGIIRLLGDWMNTRPVEFIYNKDVLTQVSLDTNGFDAILESGLEGYGWLTKLGEGQLSVRGEANAIMVVNGGGLSVEGLIGYGKVTVGLNGSLTGDGRIMADTTVNGALHPGVGVGVLGLGNASFSGGSRLALQLQSRDLFDQLDVIGTVTLGGLVDLSVELGFDPTDGVDTFPIVLNDGIDLVSFSNGGRFSYFGNPLDEMETFQVNSQFFQISYQGGDGNDVVLHAVPEPASALAIIVGGGLLALRRRRRR